MNIWRRGSASSLRLLNNMEEHILEVQSACDKALEILKTKKITFRPMQRRGVINTKKSYVLGRTNLETGLITIDIFTAKKREPKKIASILRILCHEVAHHQKKPYRERFRGKWIIRQHYPAFYEQVNENIRVLKESRELGEYFL